MKWREGVDLTGFAPYFALLQINLQEMLGRTTVVGFLILAVLAGFSIYSWAIIYAKWRGFSQARNANGRFLRAFRKAAGLEAVMLASEQFRPAPLVAVFDSGYEEISRQVKSRGTVTNQIALERSLQLGTSEALRKLENNMNWLATTASISPFIGLLGTVIGIIRSFQQLGSQGSTSMRAVGPGISEALVATAIGLFAAIPAGIFYNYFGAQLREMGARMDDFAMEFMNLAERSFND